MTDLKPQTILFDRCRICHRQLRDFESRRMGIGPVCRKLRVKQLELGIELNLETQKKDGDNHGDI